VNQGHEDDLLRDAFEELRRDARRRGAIPDAKAMLAKARETSAPALDAAPADPTRRRSASHFPRAAWLPLAAAAAVAALILVNGPSSADRDFEQLVADYSADFGSGWRSPTASLMQTPGVDLGAVPSVGSGMGPVGTEPTASPSIDQWRDS